MLYFATTNQNKINEAERILGITVKGIKLEIDEIQTLNPKNCAQKKALAAYNAFGKSILIEDTTLFFEAWNNLPGVFIDYFMKTLDNKGILRLLSNESNRRAYAQTTLAISPDGKKVQVFIGKIYGRISEKIKGNNNFGWDPIFIPDGSDKTFAEMTEGEKDKYSMRRIAFQKFKKAKARNF